MITRHNQSNQAQRVSSLAVTTFLLSLVAVSAVEAATPDITGPWEIAGKVTSLKTVEGKAPPLTAAGQKLYKQNQSRPDSDPIKACLPPGIPRVLTQKGFPFSIVIGESIGGMILEWNHLPRPLYMNVDHFENVGPTYLGQSVARWEGETLVIDTNGFNDLTWLDDSGLPHTDALHTVERLRLKDANTLENTITIEDPTIFSKPWKTVLTFTKRAGYIVKEDYCFGRTGQGKTVSK
ncbi:MAG: hypothetical protein QM808_04195 [Steroidobacteraceae bacterium]